MSTLSITPSPESVPHGRPVTVRKNMVPTIFQRIAEQSQEEKVEPSGFFQKLKAKIRSTTLVRTIYNLWNVFFLSHSASFSALKESHFRFHRTAIDGSKNRDAFPILDGDYQDAAFNRFRNGDFNPTLKLLQQGKIPIEKKEKLEELEKTINRSSFLFRFLPQLGPFVQRLLLSRKIKRLKDGEKLIFPGGMFGHSVVYEIEKKNNTFYLKMYNAGAGTAEVPIIQKFLVPQYDLGSFENTKNTCFRILQLTYQKEEAINKEYQTLGLNAAVGKIVEKNGGKMTSHFEFHTLQDRGNCSWKSLSTWVRAQLIDCQVEVTDSLIEGAKKMEHPLDLNSLRGKKIALSHLMKMVGYERVRGKLRNLLRSHCYLPDKRQVETQSRKLALRAHHTFSRKAGNVSSKEVVAYTSTLVNKILSKPAVEFYRAKKKISKPRQAPM